MRKWLNGLPYRNASVTFGAMHFEGHHSLTLLDTRYCDPNARTAHIADSPFTSPKLRAPFAQ